MRELALLVLWLGVPALALGQDSPLLQKLDRQTLEDFLREQKITFQWGQDPAKNDYFEFNLGKHRIHMRALQGRVLWVLADFETQAGLEAINDWNLKQIKSRAVKASPTTARLEWDLDINLGVTRKSLEQFLKDFSVTLTVFENHLRTQPAPAQPAPAQPAPAQPAPVPPGPKGVFSVKTQDNDRVLETYFPTGAANWETAWKVVWDVESMPKLEQEGKITFRKRPKGETDKHLMFKIKAAYLKPTPQSPWIQVLEDTFISEYYVPYHDGKTQWFDLRDHGFLETLLERETGPRGKLLGSEKLVIGEIRDRGLVYKFKNQSRRGEELVLWVNFYARNYTYLVEIAFADDGTITFRHAPTAFNLTQGSDKENTVYPHLSHMHNALWRVGIKLGPEGNNTNNEASIFRHKELPRAEKVLWPIHSAKGQTTQMIVSARYEEEAIRLEGPVDWNPWEFTRIRINNPEEYSVRDEGAKKIRNRLPIGYDLVTLPVGIARHHPVFTAPFAQKERVAAAEFSRHDFWITRADAPVYEYVKLPEYFAKNSGRVLNNTNVVIWHQSSVLHVPRAEDGVPQVAGGAITGQAQASWSAFELRPRNVFTKTPLYR